MPLFLNKVVNMKITPVLESRLTLDDAFDRCVQVTAFLFNEVVCWGLDTVSVKTKPKTYTEIDLVAKRRELYDNTDRSVTFGEFSAMLKALYAVMADHKAGGSRTATALVLGQSRETDVITDMGEVHALLSGSVLPAQAPTIRRKIANTLTAMGFRSRLPAVQLSAGERYSVMANVCRMLETWRVCDARTRTEYAAESAEIQRRMAAVPDDMRAALQGLFDLCVSDNIVHHFDRRVVYYTEDCLVPALQSGVAPDKHFFYDRIGKARSKSKRSYTLDMRYFEYLRACPVLWQGPTARVVEQLDMLELIMDHSKHTPVAAYPMMSPSEHGYRYQHMLGSNYNDYALNATGTDVGDRTAFDSSPTVSRHCDFTGGKDVDKLYLDVFRGRGVTPITAMVHTIDKRHNGSVNPSPYFDGLKLWHIKPKGSTHLFEFIRRGKTVEAFVKEPSIVRRNGCYELRINMVAGIEGDSTQNMDAKNFFATALPEHNKETAKNAERFARLAGRTVRVLGVDLGLSVPFAWAVAETTISGFTGNAASIVATGCKLEAQNAGYDDLLRHFFATRKVFGITRSMASGFDPADDWNTSSAIAEVIAAAKAEIAARLPTISSPTKVAAYTTFLAATDHYSELYALFEAHNGNLEAMKKDVRFIGGILFKYLSWRFGALKEARRMRFTAPVNAATMWDREFKWLSIIKEMGSATRRLSYFGSGNNRDAIKTDVLNDYHTGCKDNYLKQLAAAIVGVAVRENCGIIALEDLGMSAAQLSLNRSSENFLFSLWSPKRIFDTIVNAASWYGVEVITVSEAMTSQVCYDTRRIGYRHGRDLYYVDASGNVVTRHADENAAANVALRAISRHADLAQVYIPALFNSPDAVGFTDGAHHATAPRAGDENRETKTSTLGVRMRGFLRAEFGGVAAAQARFNGIKGLKECVYKDGQDWITADEKDRRVEAIKIAAGV